MRLGVTGTQRGATNAQLAALWAFMNAHNLTSLHHGDCVGVDAQAHVMAVALGVITIGHPSTVKEKRAHCRVDEAWEPKAPLKRNHDIVDCTGHLVALPLTEDEQLRSGTWATVRYAKKLGRPVTIINPDGSLTTHNQEGA